MTDASRAAFSEGTFNWRVTTQGLMACVCLLGLSSMPNSSWLVYPAIAVFAYTIHAGAPVRQLFSSSGLRTTLSSLCPRILASLVGILIAGLFSDGPGVLAAVGSLLFVLMLAVAGLFVATFLFRAGRCAARWASEASLLAYEHLRLQVRLIWLCVAG